MTKTINMTEGNPIKLIIKFAIPLLIFNIVKMGIPAGFQYALVYISNVILQRVVNGFGTDTIGAFTATTQIEMLIQQIYAAIGAAIVTFTGQNIGAGRIDRVKEGMKSSLEISAVISGILLVIVWLFGRNIMGIFVSDNEVISIAYSGIRITSIFFMGFGASQIIRFLLNGAGDSMYAMANGGVEIAARVGFAFLLTSIPKIGMWGIWLTTGLTWVLTALFALWRYKGDAWISKSLVTETK